MNLLLLCLLWVQGMTLRLYRKGQHFIDYMAYLVARGTSVGVLAQHITVANKVLQWLHTKDSWQHTKELSGYYTRFVQCMSRCPHERISAWPHRCMHGRMAACACSVVATSMGCCTTFGLWPVVQ